MKIARAALAVASIALLFLLVVIPFSADAAPGPLDEGRAARAPGACGIDSMNARHLLAPAVPSGSTPPAWHLARVVARLSAIMALALCVLRKCRDHRAQWMRHSMVYSIINFIGHPCNAPPLRGVLG